MSSVYHWTLYARIYHACGPHIKICQSQNWKLDHKPMPNGHWLQMNAQCINQYCGWRCSTQAQRHIGLQLGLVNHNWPRPYHTYLSVMQLETGNNLIKWKGTELGRKTWSPKKCGTSKLDVLGRKCVTATQHNQSSYEGEKWRKWRQHFFFFLKINNQNSCQIAGLMVCACSNRKKKKMQ